MWAYESVFIKFIQSDFAVLQPKIDGVTVPRIRKLMDWQTI